MQAACVSMLLPLDCCCPVTGVLGLMGLMLMQEPEVKALFHSRR